MARVWFKSSAVYSGLGDDSKWVTESYFAGPEGGGIPSPSFVSNVQEKHAGFWYSLSILTPLDLSIALSPFVQCYDGDDGRLVGYQVSDTIREDITGLLPGPWANGVGVKIIWETGYRSERRVVEGSTQVVPVAGLVYGAGIPGGLVGPALDAAASGLISQPPEVGSLLGLRSRARAAQGLLPALVPVHSWRQDHDFSFRRSRRVR